MARGGAGTRKDPRRRDKVDGRWWEQLLTMAVNKRGPRFVVAAFDPRPTKEIVGGLAKLLKQAKVSGFSRTAPTQVTIDAGKTRAEPVDPLRLLKNRKFAKRAGLGEGLFAEDRLLSAASVDLGPRTLSELVLRFDHSNIKEGTAAVMHVAQWNENGDPEGGMTIVAVAPVAG
jgi:hypothetical protein